MIRRTTMSPFLNDASVKYRVDKLQMQAHNNRMVRAAKARTMLRANSPLKEALGNGLIALGERLVELPPETDRSPLDTAA
jgi:hypothetical protein